eukprot:10369866-Alexandrium_andersonii.AAC.1
MRRPAGQDADGLQEGAEVAGPSGACHHVIFQGAWHLRSLKEDHALQAVGEGVSVGVGLEESRARHVGELQE